MLASPSGLASPEMGQAGLAGIAGLTTAVTTPGRTPPSGPAQRTRHHEATATLRGTATVAHGARTTLLATRMATHGVRASLDATGAHAVTHGARASLKGTRTRAHGSRGTLRRRVTTVHSARATLRIRRTVTAGSRALLRARKTRAHGVAANLQGALVENFGPRVTPGVSPGVSLVVVASSSPGAGVTVTGKDILATVTSVGEGATFVDCVLRGGIRITNDKHFTLRNCRVGVPGQRSGEDGIAFDNFEAYACDIMGFSDGAKINGLDVIMEDCRVRTWGATGDHNDGLQNNAGTGNVTIRYCDIDADPVNGLGGANAAFFWSDGATGLCILEYNLFAGGGFVVRCDDSGTFRVRHNRWVRNGFFGTHTADGTILEWTDNAFLGGGVIDL